MSLLRPRRSGNEPPSRPEKRTRAEILAAVQLDLASEEFPEGAPLPKMRLKFDSRARAAALEHCRKWGKNYAAMAAAAGVSREVVASWSRENRHGFGDAVAAAREEFVGRCEQAAIMRAVDGWGEERIGKDGLPYTVTRYSDTLLALLLKANDPKYGDKLKVDQTTTTRSSFGLALLPASARAKLRATLAEVLPLATAQDGAPPQLPEAVRDADFEVCGPESPNNGGDVPEAPQE